MKKVLLVALLLTLIIAGIIAAVILSGEADPFANRFDEACAQCHGNDLQGIPGQGNALLGEPLKHGESVAALSRSIAHGYPAQNMPAFAQQFSAEDIRGLAIYIAERRVDRLFTDFKVDAPVSIPKQALQSEQHRFRIEVVTDQLDPLPFSIAPLPDGRILVTEKMRGLRIVDTQGQVSALITGTPRTYDDGIEAILIWGHGWLLDVALHPDYATNGWIYLHHTQRCEDCWLIPRSFNRVVRGRIRDGQWVDEQEIWYPGPEYNSFVPDVVAGGRLAFDDSGYLYLSVGLKGKSNFDGVQDLATPWGKIHRITDEGETPPDNPFVDRPGAYPTTWTYGHRTPQGLEFNHASQTLWGTEMGPRGGDELNLLLPGKNYGWPLYSLGLNYDGSAINYAQWLDIAFELHDIEQPVVDFTPAPAVSSFIFYAGDKFPKWQGNALVTSLKGSELYRVILDDNNRFVDWEVLLRQLARIRDIETGPDGTIYLLLEHKSGGQILRLVPDE